MIIEEYSYAMRSKEDAQDYRYFPDPDLTPVFISDEWLERIREKQPEFRTEKMERYKGNTRSPLDYDIEITGSKPLADLFEEAAAICGQPKKGEQLDYGRNPAPSGRRKGRTGGYPFFTRASGIVNRHGGPEGNQWKNSDDIFEVMYDRDVDPEAYAEEKGLKTVNDEGLLRSTIEKIVEDNPSPWKTIIAVRKRPSDFWWVRP